MRSSEAVGPKMSAAIFCIGKMLKGKCFLRNSFLYEVYRRKSNYCRLREQS